MLCLQLVAVPLNNQQNMPKACVCFAKFNLILSSFAGTHEGSDVCSMAAGPRHQLPERTGEKNLKSSPAFADC